MTVTMETERDPQREPGPVPVLEVEDLCVDLPHSDGGGAQRVVEGVSFTLYERRRWR